MHLRQRAPSRIACDSLVALGCAAAVVPLLLWRIADEEALMRREFGPAWEADRRRTWRLVPFVF